MSADIWFKGESHCIHGGHNITYNLTKMLTEAGFEGHHETQGWKARRYGLHLLRVHQELLRDPQEYRRFNPPNGWGTYEIALEFTLSTGVCAVSQPKRATVTGWL